MAIKNLDELSALSLETFPQVYEVIMEGIAERITILRSFGYDLNFFNEFGHPFYNQPNLSQQMNNLMHCIYTMGQYFTDLSADYIPDSYSNFPKTCSLATKTETEYPLGISLTTGDNFSEADFARWRFQFKVAAAWLNRFVYFAVPSSYQKTTQRTNNSVSWSDSDPGPSFTPTDMSEREGRTMSFYFFDGRDERLADTVTSTPLHELYGERRATAYTGLEIDNRSPYAANCLLYLVMRSASSGPGRYDGNYKRWQTKQYEMTICSGVHTDPSDNRYHIPSKVEYTVDNQVFINGEWKTGEWMKQTTNYDNDGRGIDERTQQREMWYSDYGDKSMVYSESDETSEYHSWYTSQAKNILELGYYNYDRVWDGLGIWTDMQTPISEVVPAHTKKVLQCTRYSTLPFPSTNWAALKPAGWTHGSYDWTDEGFVEYEMRVVPILDFTQSVTTFNLEDSSGSGASVIGS